jgi:hypothetical protein
MAFPASLTDAGTIPIGQAYKPGTGFAAIQASLITNTDGSSNLSAPIAFHHASGTVLLLASAAQTTTPVTNGPYVVGPYAELAVDVNITAKTGTAPTIQFFVDRIGADSIAYNIWSSSVISNTAPAQVSTSIGSGFAVNQSFGSSIQFRWIIGGSATPGFTFSVSILAK